MYALGGPLYQYGKALQAGKSLKETFHFKLRRDTYCWIVPKGDRLAVVYGMEFPIKSDKIIGNQILTVWSSPNFQIFMFLDFRTLMTF